MTMTSYKFCLSLSLFTSCHCAVHFGLFWDLSASLERTLFVAGFCFVFRWFCSLLVFIHTSGAPPLDFMFPAAVLVMPVESFIPATVFWI
jgi:hypothetical protein